MQHEHFDTQGAEEVDWDDEPSGAVKWIVIAWLAGLCIGASLIVADVGGLI